MKKFIFIFVFIISSMVKADEIDIDLALSFQANCFMPVYLDSTGLEEALTDNIFSNITMPDVKDSYSEDIIIIYNDGIALQDSIIATVNKIRDMSSTQEKSDLLNLLDKFNDGGDLNSQLDWAIKVIIGYYFNEIISDETEVEMAKVYKDVTETTCSGYSFEFYEMLEYGKAVSSISENTLLEMFEGGESSMFLSDRLEEFL